MLQIKSHIKALLKLHFTMCILNSSEMGLFLLLFPLVVTYKLFSCLLIFLRIGVVAHPNLAVNSNSFSVWNLESIYIQMPSWPFPVVVQQIVDGSNYADAISCN